MKALIKITDSCGAYVATAKIGTAKAHRASCTMGPRFAALRAAAKALECPESDVELVRVADAPHAFEATKKSPNPNTGIRFERTLCQDSVGRLEKSLLELWQRENENRVGVNFGNGLLQGLFCKRDDNGSMEELHTVTNSERMVAASVVQWLGTNVGRCFLEQAFNAAGWTLVIRAPKHS